MPEPACFDGSDSGFGCNSCSRHAQGTWEATTGDAPYRLTAALLGKQGAGISIDNNSAHHHGACADRGKHASGRYAWRPSMCTIWPFERERACQALRTAGPSILLVGDSTMAQLFLSLVMLLGGQLGRNVQIRHVLTELTASACSDTVRLNFVRSDLLLYAPSKLELRQLAQCDASSFSHPFFTRAARADVVVVSTGPHWVSTVMRRRLHLSPVGYATFARAVNHSLRSIAHGRAERGFAPSSLVVVDSTHPVPNCQKYSSPVDQLELVAAYASRNRTVHADGWEMSSHMNWQLRALATAVGSSTLRVGALSALRPDAAMAHGSRRRTAEVDCLHFCMPGPTDAFAGLLLNLLGSWAPPPNRPAGSSLFFSVPAADWLSKRGAGEVIENDPAYKRDDGALPPPRQSLSGQWWWPFAGCGRSRAAMSGASWSRSEQAAAVHIADRTNANMTSLLRNGGAVATGRYRSGAVSSQTKRARTRDTHSDANADK